MGIIEDVYNVLSGDEFIKSMLSESEIETGEPAIYDTWASPYESYPFITLRYNRNKSTDLYKFDVILNIDIWDYGNSTVDAEKIRDRLKHLLDYKVFENEVYRSYYISDMVIPDEPNIIHWNMEIRLIDWKVK